MAEKNKEVAKRTTSEVTRNEEKRERFIRPRTTVHDLDNAVKIVMDLPGVSKENLEISYNRGELTVIGRRESWDREKMKPVYVERFDGGFKRVFAIDETLDAEKIDAKLNNGVLEITIPKVEAEKPKKIEIKTA